MTFYRVNWVHSEDGAGPGENFYFRAERPCMDFALLHHGPPYSSVTVYRCTITDGDPKLKYDQIFNSYVSTLTASQKSRSAKLKREAKDAAVRAALAKD